MAPKHGKTLNQPAYSLRKNSLRLYVNFRVQLPRLDFNSLKSDLFLYNRLTFLLCGPIADSPIYWTHKNYAK